MNIISISGVSSVIILILLMLFFFLSKKENWDQNMFSTFECGYSAYYNARFSFSIHYFLVALMFLFLDLEICVIMPLFNELSNSISNKNIALIVLIVLISSLILEWKELKLDWIF